MRMIPKEVSEDICASYPSVNVNDLAKRHGIGTATVYRALARAGKVLQPVTKSATRICPFCKRTIPNDSKFCCYCGKDARPNKDILIEKLKKAQSSTAAYPTTMQTQIACALSEAVEYIQAH